MHQLIGTIADLCSIIGCVIGIPGLVAIYLQVRRSADQRKRKEWADMMKFKDISDNIGVNIADFSMMPFLPRIGEEITIPEATPSSEALPKYGYYRIDSIHYVCFSNDDGHAELGNIHIGLKPIVASRRRTETIG